jgi:anhydro-N-acetylmuramic acid kinase
MSGTSLDGIDAVLMDFSAITPKLVTQHHQRFPTDLHNTLSDLITANQSPTAALTRNTSRKLADAYIDAIKNLLNIASADDPTISANSIRAVGNHGQTVFHAPPISVQLDDGKFIAKQTGIRVINQFRQADLKLGGQGAPLVPAFHRHVFGRENHELAVLNIGGIANLTLLMAEGATRGFDTGPGNTLMDLWIKKYQNKACDTSGDWARQGAVQPELLANMLDDPWLNKAPPKSTGREHFNLVWLGETLDRTSAQVAPQDVQATLCELTAASIARSMHTEAPEVMEMIVCGGGAHNHLLMERLQALLPDVSIHTSNVQGIHPDWIEAAAFAWLAMANDRGIPGNLPAVTGAREACILGVVHEPA